MSDLEISRLGRRHRRASVSLPSGLNLLLKIAEHSWQASPKVNSFDELQEIGLAANNSRYNGQDQRLLGYNLRDRDRSESDLDEISDYSEMEQYPSPAPFPRRNSRTRSHTVQLQPKNPVDPDEDEILAEIRPKPLSSRRKSATVPPLKIQNSNFFPPDPEGFPGSSSPLTSSPSSISGLIKGKWNSMAIPQVFKKKKPREYKLQAFVAFLFLTILLLVGSIYVIHKEKELHKAYFEQIRFSGKERKIRAVNMKGKEVLSGILGVSLTKKDKPWPCLEENMRPNSTCLEWMNRGRLYFRKVMPKKDSQHSSSAPGLASIQCYEVFWESLNNDFELKDCFYVGENKGFHWYGGGEMATNQWPLNRTKIPFSPFVTGNKLNLNVTVWTGAGPDGKKQNSTVTKFECGRVLSRYFINSPGASIKVTPETPFHVSVNEGNNGMLCVGGKREGFPLTIRNDYLNYSICTGDNIKDVTSFMADKDIWDGLKHEDVQQAYAITQFPIWRILPQTLNQGNASELSLLNHTDRIAALHFSVSEGFILIDESWQSKIGDLSMDPERFPTVSETFNITRRRGFKVALTLSPFFSTESSNYVEGLKEGLWAHEEGRHREVPALTRYKDWKSVALLDTTRGTTRTWLEEKVKRLVVKYGIDAVYLDLGTSQDLPQYYEFPEEVKTADNLGKYFVESIRRVKSVATIGVSSAVQLPKLPTFVGMSPTESSWAGLQSVIPNILSVGSSGYPFIIPGPIGGDYTPDGVLPDRNLYIRWLELAHFLPVVQYSYLPNDYDSKVVDIASGLNARRKSKLSQYIKKAFDDSLTSGLPIIRPLWMLDPTDTNCLRISDEFLIGADILVAPILSFNTTERDIYLPKGKWRDEIDGSNTKGEKWLRKIIREDQIAFFTKLQDYVSVPI